MSEFTFADRHIGPGTNEIASMLESIGAKNLESLIEQTIPDSIRAKEPLKLPAALSEFEFLKELRSKAVQNKLYKSYIGAGYYDTITPGVILRNIFENPGWYTAYTPYQAEIAQGRLEALLNFQTMIVDLTGMEIANASLLDEATAVGEAILMMHAAANKDGKNSRNKCFVSSSCFVQTIDVLKTRTEPLNIELVIGNHREIILDESFCGAVLQYPDAEGWITDYAEFVNSAHERSVYVTVATDLMSLTLLKPPGEWGADIVAGNSQRFGVPLGYGGPHAAFLSTKEHFKRLIPGRIIGVSVDSNGHRALRMALQTREQHIRRDKATSNICTAQVLLSVMAAMYAVYHGPKGLKGIATRIHRNAVKLANAINQLGISMVHHSYFDTIKIETDTETSNKIRKAGLAAGINFGFSKDQSILISIDETTSDSDIQNIISVFEKILNPELQTEKMNIPDDSRIPDVLARKSPFMTHPVFNTHHSETEMLRYIKSLEAKDLALNHSMIPLGSCTMKLNATSEMIPVTWTEFSSLHPFVPKDQAKGYLEIFKELESFLCEITGFDAVSLQPNSGAQGEYAGLLVIRAFHKNAGNSHRDVVLIPSSAHGTNPASAVMAGLKVVVVKCDEKGNIDVGDMRAKASTHRENLAALMVTYPSTHGVFEESIKEITQIIHECGGQVYMDGANMNAQVGLTKPALIGADVCHINLHKTFAIPHGGGGPGMGPIAVAAHLAPFLPSHTVVVPGEVSQNHSIHAVSAAPWGSASILLISYAYMKMLGGEGVTQSTRIAILNANYLKSRLEKYYPVLYQGTHNRVAHEMILDCRHFKQNTGIEVADIAKRLMDYGYHAPTVSFPVAGTLMIEPTESESKEELDRFCEALISIRHEIDEIESGKQDRSDNVLKNAPHTASEATSDNWKHSYSRQKAVYPAEWLRKNKFWVPVGRIDDAFGDRNFMCTCPPIENFEEVVSSQ